MILLLALLSDHLVIPAEYLRDPTVGILLLGEDIRVFWGKESRRVRFRGLAVEDLLLEESRWERGGCNLDPEYLRMVLSEIDSVWVYLPLHDIKDKGPLEECLVPGGCAAIGVPVGIAGAFSLFCILVNMSGTPIDMGISLALGYLAIYSGGCLGAVGGWCIGSYIYEKNIGRPASEAKTQLLLDRLRELGGEGVR